MPDLMWQIFEFATVMWCLEYTFGKKKLKPIKNNPWGKDDE